MLRASPHQEVDHAQVLARVEDRLKHNVVMQASNFTKPRRRAASRLACSAVLHSCRANTPVCEQQSGAVRGPTCKTRMGRKKPGKAV